MSRKVAKMVALGSVGLVTTALLLPNEYIPVALLPVYHLVNVARAGIHMGLIYKFSSKPET